jgi:16S rRNA processing protein RimM
MTVSVMPMSTDASPSQATAERRVIVGKVVGSFGVMGWVKVDSYTDPPQNLLKFPKWRLSIGSEQKECRPVQGRLTAKGLQVQLEGVMERNAADLLRGAMISVARGELPRLPRGQYYWDDLIGLSAYSSTGAVLGTISDIRATPAHALLQIDGERGGKAIQHLVPLVKERVLKVDLEQRRVELDWEADWT